MNFNQLVFLENNLLGNIRKKVGFWGNYPLIFTLSGQSYDSKNYFQKLRLFNLCHEYLELQKNLKHLKFWSFFYWKHDKATQMNFLIEFYSL